MRIHLPVNVGKVSLVKLSNEILESLLHLLSVNLTFIRLIFGPKIIRKENTNIVKPRHLAYNDISLFPAIYFVVPAHVLKLARNFPETFHGNTRLVEFILFFAVKTLT